MPKINPNIYAALDEIPIGVCLISKERKIFFMNRTLEALTGFTREECGGLPCSHVLRFNNCFENCPVNKLDERERCVLEGDIINQDHQKVPVRVSFAPLLDGGGKITGYIETVDDLRRECGFDPAGMHPFSLGRIIGRSPQMERIFRFLPVIAQSEAPVLITGQIGTGKDLLAEAVHHASARAKNPYVTFRCGALPESLAEAELFGAERGAVQGGESRPGKFRLAQNGTLYLAEVGELSASLQLKLLNYLDEKTIYPLGSTKSYLVNVRVIAASSGSLDQVVREGGFRKDLFFRLNAVSLHLPLLKERGDDLRLLMDHFLRARASLLNKTVTGFSDKCLKVLEEYEYPGNILELKHIIEYSVDLCRDEKVRVRDLPTYLCDGRPEIAAPGPDIAPWPSAGEMPADANLDWSAVERKMILDALLKANGRRTGAARLLGWGRSTLWRKMKQYGMLSAETENADESA